MVSPAGAATISRLSITGANNLPTRQSLSWADRQRRLEFDGHELGRQRDLLSDGDGRNVSASQLGQFGGNDQQRRRDSPVADD